MDLEDVFSDDDYDEVLDFLNLERKAYTVKDRINPFEDMDDGDFIKRFRLKKETVLFILTLVEHQLETPTNRNHAISPINQLLVTLRFYATGSFLMTIRDTMNISKSATCNIAAKVSLAIASLTQFINMPTTREEILQTRSKFYEKSKVPRIIGAIDCTHIRIQSPGGHNAEVFRNRKGFFSINVQTISDTNLKILDIVARWPRSAHDYDNSAIHHRLENANEFGNSILVADSGYRNTTHIITPLRIVNNEVEQLYNDAVIRTRNPVERQYGVWKRRFPVLALGLRLKLERNLTVIVACAVLHNIAIDHKEDLPPDDADVLPQDINFEENINQDIFNIDDENAIARTILINRHFTRLLENNV